MTSLRMTLEEAMKGTGSGEESGQNVFSAAQSKNAQAARAELVQTLQGLGVQASSAIGGAMKRKAQLERDLSIVEKELSALDKLQQYANSDDWRGVLALAAYFNHKQAVINVCTKHGIAAPLADSNDWNIPKSVLDEGAKAE